MDCLFSDITEVGSKKDQDHPPVAGLESKQQFLCLQPSLTSICIQQFLIDEHLSKLPKLSRKSPVVGTSQRRTTLVTDHDHFVGWQYYFCIFPLLLISCK